MIEKYYKIGRSELCWDISGLYKDGPNITHYYILLLKWLMCSAGNVHFFSDIRNLQISGPSLYNPKMSQCSSDLPIL